MENRLTELDERIDRLSTIKAIGWTTLLIFGFVVLLAIYYLGGTFIITFPSLAEGLDVEAEEIAEMSTMINQFRAMLVLFGLVTLTTSLGGIGLLRFKNWGLILFQSTTIVYIFLIIGGLAYYIISIKMEAVPSFDDLPDDPVRHYFDVARSYQTIGYGTFSLLTAWILTRTNILLSKGIYRQEFR